MSFKSFTKRFSHQVVESLPRRTLEKLVPRDVLVLFYHVVSDTPLPHIRHLYPHKTASEFEADVVYLKTHYRLPTLQQFIDDARGGEQRPRPSAILTFDDGMAECFDQVRPILLKHRVPGVFFVTKSFIDNRELFYRHKVSLCIQLLFQDSGEDQARRLRELGQRLGLEFATGKDFRTWIKTLQASDESLIDCAGKVLRIDFENEMKRLRLYMTSDQVRQLHADGFTIGGHSVRHVHFSALSCSQIESEIVESCSFAAELVGLRDAPFAFPFSADGVDRKFLRSLTARYPAVTLMFGTGGFANEEPYLINRIWADAPSGLPPGQSGIKGRIAIAYADQILRSG